MGKKKEKVIDLKPEAISADELKDLQNVVAAINKLQFDIGQMEVQKHGAMHALLEGNDKLISMQEKFVETYGTSNVNIQTGALRYEENGPSDS